MKYKILVGNSNGLTLSRTEIFSTSSTNKGLISANLNLELNKSSTFTFTIINKMTYGINNYVKDVCHIGAAVFVDREYNSSTKNIFTGYIRQIDEDLIGDLTITCIDMLDVLNQTILTPLKFTGNTLNEILSTLLLYNTGQNFYSIEYGDVDFDIELTEIDLDAISQPVETGKELYSCDEYLSIASYIKAMQSYLRYATAINCRWENGKNKINWNKISNTPQQQSIQLGENLITFNKTVDDSNIINEIRPTGIDNNDREFYLYDMWSRWDEVPADIKTLANNNGITQASFSLRTIGIMNCQQSINKYGTRGVTYKFEDARSRASLYSKAVKYLIEHKEPIEKYEIKAFDSSATGNYPPLDIGKYVSVTCSPKDIIDEKFLIAKLEIDLMNWGNNTVTVGSESNDLTNLIATDNSGKINVENHQS